MTRPLPREFQQSHGRMDKASQRARDAAASQLLAETVKSAMTATLGGLAPDLRAETAKAYAEAYHHEHTLATDGAATASWLGREAARHCPLAGPTKAEKFRSADAIFKEGAAT